YPAPAWPRPIAAAAAGTLHGGTAGPAPDAVPRTRPADRAAPAPPLDFPAVVDRDDAAGQVAVAGPREAGRVHHRLELLLRRMLADRLGQVAVAVGIAGEQPAQARQHLERVEVVERLEPVGADLGEL